MSELWQLGVVELIEQLRTRELDSAEVARAFAARAHEVDRELNCFVALAEAPALRRDGPLRGIPYAYKDVFTHAGVAPGLGLRRPERRSGVGDAAVLVRLEAQGAVALGRLQLDPLAYSTIGLNPLLGDVRNPWAPERIAGGSSSGAAAAVAAGAVAFAIGTDTGGSVRIPAAYCGVVGLKTTFGRLPTLGCAPLSPSQDVVGVLARSAADVAFVLGLPSAPRHDVTLGVDPRHRLDASAFGDEVVEVDLSLLEAFDAAAATVTRTEAAALYAHELDVAPPVLRSRLEDAVASGGDGYVDALRYQPRAVADLLARPLAQADVLVMPVVAGPPPLIVDLAETDAALEASIVNLRLNRAFNFTGVPALSVPVGFDVHGLPLAVQLVGRPWTESTLLAIAASYQRQTPSRMVTGSQ
jgi:aspartyl-tRNA(Asn)/glutamyl-tRNA(Gln) amidotransferase subunit A